MKNKALIVIISVILAVLFAVQPTAKAASETAENYKEYISEVKIGVGKTESEAASSLDGYTILSDNGKNVDLNQGAGGGIGSKGERVVYLGYKTTTDREEAITDLAVMNMKGGYSVKDYELLMQQYMTEQIIPFVENLLAIIREYRNNYNSTNAKNWERALYVHDALNKLTDDDSYDKGLGDLLLSETKYEMGDEAYEALTEYEKGNHADILTIIAQANGKATLLMENLLTRAADTNEDTWVDRFVATSYDDLLALYPDMLPSDAAIELAKEYNDDAREILAMWNALKEQLDKSDASAELFKKLTDNDLSEQQAIVDNFDIETADEKQIEEYFDATAKIDVVTGTATSLYTDVLLRDYLASVSYRDGTLADFFSQDYNTVAQDITVLYPLVASLSDGQRAGLQFVTLSDLVMLSATDSEGYKDAKTDELLKVSIYDGVDRGIYVKGGVALTSEALRAHSAEEVASEDGKLSALTYAMYCATAVSAIAFGSSAAAWLAGVGVPKTPADALKKMQYLEERLLHSSKQLDVNRKDILKFKAVHDRVGPESLYKTMSERHKGYVEQMSGEMEKIPNPADRIAERSPICSRLMIGFGVAMVVLSAVSLYMTYRDLVNYYNVEYSPIPKYIVDEKDITVYNEKGEVTVIKNLSAYYKAVETNRAEGDEWYDILGASADLNGTVGRQWLALYAAKNENESPILASSLKAVTDSDKVPADYTTGIHMFGSESAYNLNNTQFVWNNEAKSVYVYFNVDTSASGSLTTGSSFTAGYIVLAAVGGLVIGAAAAVCVTAFVNKKRRETV